MSEETITETLREIRAQMKYISRTAIQIAEKLDKVLGALKATH